MISAALSRRYGFLLCHSPLNTAVTAVNVVLVVVIAVMLVVIAVTIAVLMLVLSSTSNGSN